MKIPDTKWVEVGGPLVRKAQEIADELTLEYGIMVVVKTITHHEHRNYNSYTIVDEIAFEAMDRTFENVKTLRKALRLKAFI